MEIAFSSFKRIFDEWMSACKWDNIKGEIYAKVQLYNVMIDKTIDCGYGTPDVVEVKKPHQ